ncbi:kinase-like protein, partial [Macrolepiota fuliginosa MF-IS2]
FNREARAWKDLNHPNILKFLCFDWKLARFGLPSFISRYCENGTVINYLRNNPMADKRLIIKGVAQGLKYLHDNNVIHGDLKPNNILIGTYGEPLLCDFGRSKILTYSGFTATSLVGACRYQAPELFDDNAKLSRATDVYAFAISFYEIWTGRRPYRGITNDSAVILKVSQGMRPEPPSPPWPHQEIIWPLLEECWQKMYANRPLISQVVDRL